MKIILILGLFLQTLVLAQPLSEADIENKEFDAKKSPAPTEAEVDRKAANDQWQALAVMGELCPYGWQAQITVYGWGAPVPADAPPARVPLIELEWEQFEEESGRIAVARRVWAPTIGQALQTMVEDRQTDLTLEQIEQAAAEDDLWWSE